ncbi:sulfite exporter TauE/SafE family protein [Pseudoteredinibacter isoporae]|uniref:sulfite exporter TauE/SafE family protein n=1 Tax=Pseudoteredinibacter isoporae TaxID=570281 RepID=UPI0031087F01
MDALSLSQYALIALVFVWSGIVRSGLGFGGAVLSLPFLLLIDDRPQVYLPIISVHLLLFGGLTVLRGQQQYRKDPQNDTSPVNWAYLKKAMAIMIIPKIVGVLGLISLPNDVLSGIIFVIVFAYSLSYIFNKPFKSQRPWLDTVFLILGGYISGTSLIGAPLIIAVFSKHVHKNQLRDTLFVLWVILVAIKMVAFIWVGLDLQLKHAVYLLPPVALGHWIGLKLHRRLQQAEPVMFFRVIGFALLSICFVGLYQVIA